MGDPLVYPAFPAVGFWSVPWGRVGWSTAASPRRVARRTPPGGGLRGPTSVWLRGPDVLIEAGNGEHQLYQRWDPVEADSLAALLSGLVKAQETAQAGGGQERDAGKIDLDSARSPIRDAADHAVVELVAGGQVDLALAGDEDSSTVTLRVYDKLVAHTLPRVGGVLLSGVTSVAAGLTVGVHGQSRG